MSGSHHLSPELSASIGGLLESGISMLRAEDAYHVAVLTDGDKSESAESAARVRSAARQQFSRFLDIVHNAMPSLESTPKE